jgi:riboflavin synthase alpha subunit
LLACNAPTGTCLTVTTFAYEPHSPSGGWFKVGIAPETLRKTNLGALRTGDRVNCERAMGAKTRFGGHFVQVSLLCVFRARAARARQGKGKHTLGSGEREVERVEGWGGGGVGRGR